MKAVLSSIKSALLLAICISTCICAHSQNVQVTSVDPSQPAFIDFDPNKAIFTLTGSAIKLADQADINGSPYFFNYWTKGTVVFFDGKVHTDSLLRFNLVTNQLQFLSYDKPLLFAGRVASFTLIDTAGKKENTAWFRSGYPAYSFNNHYTFYQVLALGNNVHLLRYIRKQIAEQYQYNVAAKLSYKVNEDLLIYNVQTQSMRYINNKSSKIKKVLKEVNAPVENILSSMNKKKLTEDEIVALVNEINKL